MYSQALTTFHAHPNRASRSAIVALLLSCTVGVSSTWAQPETDTDTIARKSMEGTKPAPPKAKSPADSRTPDDPKSKGPTRDGTDEKVPTAKQGWSVVIAVFRGEDQAAEAATLLTRIRAEGGLKQAYAQKRGEATVIAVGSFAAADDTTAQETLKQIQQQEVSRSKPYLAAYLAPPPKDSSAGGKAALAGALPQYNLVRARQMLGERALYTLQVAVYGRQDLARPSEADLADARKAAEEAALRFRQEGENAYYYHGNRMSMVTIGTFDTSDFDPQVPSYKSSKLRDAQRRHPYNLYNGAGINEKRKGEPARLQPSNLVAVPEK